MFFVRSLLVNKFEPGGSIREHSAKQVLFASRSIFGLASLEGVFPLAKPLDTLCVMTRDIEVLAKITENWFCGGKEIAFDRFVKELEEYLGLPNTIIDLFALWDQQDPSKEGKTIMEYIGKVILLVYEINTRINRQDDFQTMASIKNPELWERTKDFREAYAQQFGTAPYEAGRNTIPEMYEEAIKRNGIFKERFERTILGVSAEEEMRPLIVLPLSDDEPEYRYIYADVFTQSLSLTFILTNDIVGQISYQSRVSGRQEYMPAVVSFLGPPATDASLTKFAQDFLKNRQLSARVKTGSLTLEVGRNQ
ncbi:hypothetical protein M501DRAFT_1055300 [Patellaria atrata CBS 101060]|uniref:Uncharacterized protein n=1 Tax=Patellaria atrata CBS 101060 TaxID=1346257 RepID=A0A9P4SEN9_9PEZI|nr:hypothetical protein M501DRAFT_1055300 [Patellaria atrata CBS 101060]